MVVFRYYKSINIYGCNHYLHKILNSWKINGDMIVLQAVDCEEDFLVAANSDIAQLCAENILLWQHFLNVVMSSEPVRQYLARQHHIQRVSEFMYFLRRFPFNEKKKICDNNDIVSL